MIPSSRKVAKWKRIWLSGERLVNVLGKLDDRFYYSHATVESCIRKALAYELRKKGRQLAKMTEAKNKAVATLKKELRRRQATGLVPSPGELELERSITELEGIKLILIYWRSWHRRRDLSGI